MSRYGQKNELTWDLREDDDRRRRRVVKLRLVYALVDPTGYDARKLENTPGETRAMWRILTGAREQAAHHPRDRVADHVSGRPPAHDAERVAAGLP